MHLNRIGLSSNKLEIWKKKQKKLNTQLGSQSAYIILRENRMASLAIIAINIHYLSLKQEIVTFL